LGLVDVDVAFDFFSDNPMVVLAAFCIVIGLFVNAAGDQTWGPLLIVFGLFFGITAVPEKRRRRR
jgi:hypothetical protein